VKGRRIGEVASVNSFAKASKHRWDVWSHPQLVGYIDVNGEDDGPLQPMITRDEFKNTRGRGAAYRDLMKICEERLAEALAAANSDRNMKSLEHLESVLTEELRKVENQDKRAARKEKESFPEEPEETGGDEPESRAPKPPEEEPKPTSPPNPDFLVHLMDGLPEDSEGEVVRSVLHGNMIMINTHHSDFQNRFRRTRTGAPRIDERLISYLANVVSHHYCVIMGQIGGPVTDDSTIGTYCRYEERLRKALPSMNRELLGA